MINEIKENLVNGINPFWKSLKDNERGGYYGYVGFDLKVDKEAPKGVILNSRILWYFSSVYTLFKEKEDLEYAEHAYKFLVEHCVDKDYGGVYWMMDAQGAAKEDMKHTYNQAFAIYALSSYYEAKKNEAALKLALQLFDQVESTCTDDFGYQEAFAREWLPISNEKLSDNEKLQEEGVIAQKTMNTLLHVLEAYTELYRVGKVKRVGTRLRDILKYVKNKVYNEKEEKLGVFFDEQMNSICNMHSYGHDIEAAWLLDRAAEVLGDEEILKQTYAYTKRIAYKIKQEAFDGVAINNERFNEEIDTTRVWWVQAESIVGFINAYEKTKDVSFLEISQKIWNYVRKYMIDRRTGEWFWDLDKNNQPTSQKPIVEPWKCPYHNGRMCLEVIRRGIDV
ncbi:MAG: AGE family epimerase/isomerase [Cellulosilyticaceae bacterium]